MATKIDSLKEELRKIRENVDVLAKRQDILNYNFEQMYRDFLIFVEKKRKAEAEEEDINRSPEDYFVEAAWSLRKGQEALKAKAIDDAEDDDEEDEDEW